MNPEPGILNPEPAPPESDTPMTATYVEVLLLEAVIVAALWMFGRLFA
jgi:hypothetical protein